MGYALSKDEFFKKLPSTVKKELSFVEAMDNNFFASTDPVAKNKIYGIKCSADNIDILKKSNLRVTSTGDNNDVIIDGYTIRFIKSGKKAVGSTNVTGATKTVFQEVGFLLALDALLDGKDFNPGSYSPSKRLDITADVKDVLNFLSSNKEWLDVSISGAETIIKKFGKSSLKNYTFHHDSSLFKTIRSTGKSLSGLSNLDKWNPADVYLIKGQPKLNKTNIITFNECIHNKDRDIIGISLKKGAHEALHGAIALNVILSTFKIPKLTSVPNTKDKAFKKFIHSKIKELKSHPLKSIIYVHIADEDVEKSIDDMRITSNNYFKAIPHAINFIAESGNKLTDALKYAVMAASSQSPESCSHFKLQGSHLSEMPEPLDIEILKIRLKLNGDADTVIDFKLNNVQMKLQLRSKGSLPQFIIIKTAENSKATHISKLK